MARAPLRVVLHRSRIDIVARALSLLTGFVLASASLSLGQSAPTELMLMALAAVMGVWAMLTRWISHTYVWILVAEAVVATVILTQTSPSGNAWITYLAVPPFLAGLRGGLLPMLGAVVAEGSTLLVLRIAGNGSAAGTFVEVAGLWIAAGFGFGLLGAWIRILRLGPGANRRTPYASAHRLLAQLRTVSRELSGGLDRDTVTAGIISDTTKYLGGSRAVLLRPALSGGLEVVGHSGDSRLPSHVLNDPSVSVALRHRRATQQVRPGVEAQFRHRFVLPLTIGHRAVGVIVVDGPREAHPETFQHVHSLLDEQALRWESAELFDDVRRLATVEERNRLAREIHDGIAQEVASLGYTVDDLASKNCNRDHRAGLLALRQDLTRLVSDLRMSIFDLRSEEASVGLGAILGDYVREVGTSSGIAVHLSLEESQRRLSVDVETELLRIAQEAVTNARKHSRAVNLWVTCRVEPPFAEIRVEDDGIGGTADRREHYGLQIMRERAARINAVLTVTERDAGGTAVSTVLLPTDEVRSDHPSGDSDALQRAARR